MLDLMQRCWQHAPSVRPSFEEIVQVLTALGPNLSEFLRQDFEIVELAPPRPRKQSLLDALISSKRRPKIHKTPRGERHGAALLAAGEYDSDLYSG